MEFQHTGDGPEWLRGDGAESDVVVSSRVRMARNIAGYPFLTRSSPEERKQAMEACRATLLESGLAPQMMWIDLAESSVMDRSLLVERHLISKQHARGEESRAVAISTPDERLAIMVNEEDHLRIQVIRGGLALGDAYEQIDEVDDRIEARVPYAFSKRFGYLTCCPTNVGCGIRVSVMVHLPGLRMTGEIEKVRRAARSMNLAVRGFYGEGSEATGDLYQLSNQTTLGRTERQILRDFEGAIIPKVLEYERAARQTLLSRGRAGLEDKVHRAVGTLRHARLLAAEEALTLLSQARLGVMLGLLEGVPLGAISRMMLFTQPAHLQRVTGKRMEQAERKAARATLVREAFAGVE